MQVVPLVQDNNYLIVVSFGDGVAKGFFGLGKVIFGDVTGLVTQQMKKIDVTSNVVLYL